MNISGFSTGRVRHCGRLTLTPLHAPDEDCGFVADVRLAHDRSYGSMGFRTDRPGGGVAPFGWAAFFDGGQDRALREALFVQPGKVVYGGAVCLEPEQAGLWRKQKKQHLFTLPLSLQAAMPEGGGYSALWKSIERRNEAAGRKATTVKALLEGPDGARGAVLPVLSGARGVVAALDGRPVAIEIAPTAQAFSEWWAEYGLADAVAFEAATMPELPLPLSSGQDNTPDTEALAEGMHQVTWFDVLRGWVYVQAGRIVYASLVDGEAMVMFDQAEAKGGNGEFECDQYVEWEEA